MEEPRRTLIEILQASSSLQDHYAICMHARQFNSSYQNVLNCAKDSELQAKRRRSRNVLEHAGQNCCVCITEPNQTTSCSVAPNFSCFQLNVWASLMTIQILDYEYL